MSGLPRIWRLSVIMLLGGAIAISASLEPELFMKSANAQRPRPAPAKSPPKSSSSKSKSGQRTPPAQIKKSQPQKVGSKPSLVTRAVNAVRNLFRSRSTAAKTAPQTAGRQNPIGRSRTPQQNRYAGPELANYRANPYLHDNGNFMNPLAYRYGNQGLSAYAGANQSPSAYFQNNAYYGLYMPNRGVGQFNPVQYGAGGGRAANAGFMAVAPQSPPMVVVRGAGNVPPRGGVANVPPPGRGAEAQYARAPAYLAQPGHKADPGVNYSQLPANPQAAALPKASDQIAGKAPAKSPYSTLPDSAFRKTPATIVYDKVPSISTGPQPLNTAGLAQMRQQVAMNNAPPPPKPVLPSQRVGKLPPPAKLPPNAGPLVLPSPPPPPKPPFPTPRTGQPATTGGGAKPPAPVVQNPPPKPNPPASNAANSNAVKPRPPAQRND